jgi:hypothetical protein
MIAWRIDGGDPPSYEEGCGLAPVSFCPDIAVAVVVPMTVDPAGVRMRRLLVDAWNPDVSVAVPAVVACVPGPIGVLVWGRRNDLVDWSWWADAYYDLGVCDACGKEESTDG